MKINTITMPEMAASLSCLCLPSTDTTSGLCFRYESCCFYWNANLLECEDFFILMYHEVGYDFILFISFIEFFFIFFQRVVHHLIFIFLEEYFYLCFISCASVLLNFSFLLPSDFPSFQLCVSSCTTIFLYLGDILFQFIVLLVFVYIPS